jgi:CMD domain protein
VHRVAEAHQEALGPRLAAALEHVHMLVFHPRDADVRSLQALLDAGWSTTEVVTLSQLVAFLSFQIRVVAGLKVLAAKV